MACADQPLKDTLEKMGEVEKEIGIDEGQQQKQLQSKCKSNSAEDIRRKRIFVGGLASGTSKEEFKKYFEKFGKITDVVVMQDSVTHKPRGFGFITFDSEKSVEEVLVNSFHDLNGKQVEVKRVVLKEEKCVCDKLRCKNRTGTSSQSFPLPGYNNNVLYVPASNTYGGWYPMNGYGVPCDPYRNIVYVPMVPIAQPSLNPAYFLPNLAYIGGNAGQ